MNDGRTRCPHGHLALRVEDAPTYGAGYRQAFADGCRLCDGKPAGVPWREPDKDEQESAE